MAILVVGSVAFDSIETPHGKRAKILGGAATHFSLAASYFTDVRVIAVVGEDFGPEHEAVFAKRGIDTRGIERAKGLSFHWTGAYAGTLAEAQTLGTDLNVFERFEPKIPDDVQRQRISLPRKYRSCVAGTSARRDVAGAHGLRRHHELLDQGPRRQPRQGAA